METCTLGGVIRGYCAMGSVNSAMAPITVMSTDNAGAKNGRSMQHREMMTATSKRMTGRSFPSLLLLGWRQDRRGQSRHGDPIGGNQHAGTNLLERADDYPVVRAQAFHHTQA